MVFISFLSSLEFLCFIFYSYHWTNYCGFIYSLSSMVVFCILIYSYPYNSYCGFYFLISWIIFYSYHWTSYCDFYIILSSLLFLCIIFYYYHWTNYCGFYILIIIYDVLLYLVARVQHSTSPISAIFVYISWLSVYCIFLIFPYSLYQYIW